MPVTRANILKAQGLEGTQHLDGQDSCSGEPNYGPPLSGALSQNSHTSASGSLATWYPVGADVDQLIANHQAPSWGTFAPTGLADSQRSSQDSQHYANLARPASSQALRLDMMQVHNSSPHSRRRDFGGASHSEILSSHAPHQDVQDTMHQTIHTARPRFGSTSGVHNQERTEATLNVNGAFTGHGSSPQRSAAMYALCADPSQGLGISSSDSQLHPVAYGHIRHASFDHLIPAPHQQERLLRLQAMTPLRRIDQPYLPMSAPGLEKRLIGPSSAPLMTGGNSRMSNDRAAFLRSLSSGHPFMSSPPSPGASLVSPSVTPSSVFHTRDGDSTRHSPITPASFGDGTRFPSTMASHRNSMSLDESFTSSSGTDHLSRASSLAKDSEGVVKRVEVRRLQGKKRLTVGDRKLVCQRHLENPTQKQEQLAREFGVERSTVSKILKEKEKWLSMPDDSTVQATATRSRPPRWPDLEQRLGDWMFAMEEQGIAVYDNMIREKALEMAQNLYGDVGNFKGSQGWIEKFKERAALARHGITSSQEDGGSSKAKKGRATGAAASSGPVRRHRKAKATATYTVLDGPAVGVQPTAFHALKRTHDVMTSDGRPQETASDAIGALKHEDFFHLPNSPIVEPAKRRRRLNDSVASSRQLRTSVVGPNQQDLSGPIADNYSAPRVKVEPLPHGPFQPIDSSTFGQEPPATAPHTPLRRVLRPRNRHHAQREPRAPLSAPAHEQMKEQPAEEFPLLTAESSIQGPEDASGVDLNPEREPKAQPAGMSSDAGNHTLHAELTACSGVESNTRAWPDFLNSGVSNDLVRVPFAPDFPLSQNAAEDGKQERLEPSQVAPLDAFNKPKEVQLEPQAKEQHSVISLLQARSSLQVVIRYLSQEHQKQDQDDTGAGAQNGAGAGLVARRHFLSMGSLQSSIEGLIERETGVAREGELGC